MTDLLAKGADWLTRKRQEHLARPVTYQRPVDGGDQTVELNATVGQTVFRLDDSYPSGAGGGVRVVSRDYLVQASDLVLDGQTVLPQRGDVIIEIAGDKSYVHEVMAPGGEPEWRYSDPQRTSLRIHTKQVNIQ
jgi:hypothetical protein